MITPEPIDTQKDFVNQLSSATLKIRLNQVQEEKKHQAQLTNQVKQCRICLSSSLQSTQNFIQPCQCTGSLKYVHQICFNQWMKRLLLRKNNGQIQEVNSSGVQCQLCKMNFSLQIKYEKVCITWSKLKQKIKRNKFQFSILCVFIILCAILLSITVALLPSDIFSIQLNKKVSNSRGGSQFSEGWQKIVLIVSCSILIIILLIATYLLVRDFGFTYLTQFSYKGRQIKTLKVIFDQ